MKSGKNIILKFVLPAVFAAGYAALLKSGSIAAEGIGKEFVTFMVYMLKILPPVFVLIGLFEVWVKKETVEKHMGMRAGIEAYLWAIMLAGTTAGGMYVAFPVARTLYGKGAKLSVIFTYVGAAGICRIPMTAFEASFMGVKFTAVRLLVSIPLLIISSIILGKHLEKTGYRMG